MKILGKTTRGKIFRLALLSYLLYLDLEAPGYLQFKNPIEPFVSWVPVANLLSCPSDELVAIPPIPIVKSLETKRATEDSLRAKFGNPVCKKNNQLYFKLESMGIKYFLKTSVDESGKITGYSLYKDN